MLTEQCSILLVDDDNDVLDAYTRLLELAGYHVTACNDPLKAQFMVSLNWPGIVLSDVCMPGCSGIELLELFHQLDTLLPVLLITGHGDVPVAVDAVKKGAWDFLQKPVEPTLLLQKVEEALSYRQHIVSRRKTGQEQLNTQMVGNSKWIAGLRQQLQQLAETSLAVWFHGEHGSGKTFAATQLHALRMENVDSPVVLRAVTEGVPVPVEHWTNEAKGGMLILRNPELLDVQQQQQLVALHNTEGRSFRLVGVSLYSAVELVVQGKLSVELYHCFALTQISCLPLSRRHDDIEPLFTDFLRKACFRLNVPLPEINAGLRKDLLNRMWSNNIRELANMAELFAVGITSPGETSIPGLHLTEQIALDERIDEYERKIIKEALNMYGGRINEVADYLHIPRKKLYLRMKKHGLSKDPYRKGAF
ncbi:sigma-54-dependent transcriptional regulator [Citrobacter portucalensis]|uniref:sigma-54-dependent transcriptional regulator n=1 Tax=Citrobacter portucalensis TaxID=1639133 RepID=UPI001C63D1F5|nr:response regulator [Citrobacter portucalensis]MBW7619974.1 response regulator [Citrobacter portucalensis]MBW7639359.1 response regulator [Citrobacter portucalensis]MCA2133694.1 response regulator [Citrobacter portucalensis]MCA2144122.1 response regulator [Citrobacter portucalensis]MCA2148787.1 response regulator [Citrobacter portucalensis]